MKGSSTNVRRAPAPSIGNNHPRGETEEAKTNGGSSTPVEHGARATLTAIESRSRSRRDGKGVIPGVMEATADDHQPGMARSSGADRHPERHRVRVAEMESGSTRALARRAGPERHLWSVQHSAYSGTGVVHAQG